jgi:hypothetical protein
MAEDVFRIRVNLIPQSFLKISRYNFTNLFTTNVRDFVFPLKINFSVFILSFLCAGKIYLILGEKI